MGGPANGGATKTAQLLRALPDASLFALQVECVRAIRDEILDRVGRLVAAEGWQTPAP
jgi:hypothetical protein